ncbi:long-chain acyl-CoA synthetase [Halanaerobium saccharolyticum]|uniref:Long-chain acyl-CoA synthetase n=1 Tax=Halanaerobium saccharolyticum TaxID=43595 RepID=A0A4R7Z696_9FIRM|nr:AMP-binding protein [Halanaerobium saccharolyticum]RAK11086.1 long-chain acyl-CoA synthetase [Halanaerobium saccharolyticum]TDW06937.1 long-chain acyl-CoA synthetase [Halanaerobium saccharolyticum]TDX63702.1 long-chain acyl-CoA synthetase [Halanaerobium saccharolyticum]
MLIYDKVLESAEKNPEKIALINGNQKITYRELSLKIRSISLNLSKKFSAGDKLIIKVKDPIKALLYLYGAARANLISILIEADLSEKDEKNIIRKVKPVSIIESKLITLNDDLKYMVKNNEAASQLLKPKKEDIFLGALSSGSTGKIKVIWRDHQSWTSAFEIQKEIFSFNENSKLLITGSIVYTGNLNNILQLLAAGGTVVFPESIFPKHWLKIIEDKEINALFMVPAHYRILLKEITKTMNKVKSIVTAGSKMDLETLKKLKKYFPEAEICEFYGASELSYVSYAYYDQLLKNKGTVGRAFPGVDIKIKNKEVWVKSPYLAPAYRPEASAKDLGYFKGSYLYLSGRKDNIINKAGNKVNPYKLESVLKSNKKIAEAAVITADDFLKDKLLIAAIVKSNPDLKIKEVYKYCRENLKTEYLPDKIHFIKELPKMKSGKLDRKKLANNLKEKYK